MDFYRLDILPFQQSHLLSSEGFDRLSTAHFLEDTAIPVIGPLNSVTWFGVISLMGSVLGILVSQLLIARMEKRGMVSRTGIVLSASAGYILCLVLFALSRNFWFMLPVFLLAGLTRTIKEPVLAAWMNDHVEEKMRATVFSTGGQLDALGQIIGGPIAGLVAQQVSAPWGLVCTALMLLPALALVPVAAVPLYQSAKHNIRCPPAFSISNQHLPFHQVGQHMPYFHALILVIAIKEALSASPLPVFLGPDSRIPDERPLE